MCGIVGIYNHHVPVASELYDSLIHLQHRGQDAAGILTSDQQSFYMKHGLGLVREVFGSNDISELKGNIGIAHVRYPTAGGKSISDAQPLSINHPFQMALAHNGNLVNHLKLSREIKEKYNQELTSSTDSEVLLHMFANAFNQEQLDPAVKPRDDNVKPLDDNETNDSTFFSHITDAIKNIFKHVQGSYSVVCLIAGKGLVVFRDPHGIRPLIKGERLDEQGKKDYIFASETTMLYGLGFEPVGDVQPGEVIYVNHSGEIFKKIIETKPFTPCIFEYVYFARPDSTLNEVNVYRARLRMGQNLAIEWKKKHPGVLPDVVIPAPFTSNTAALSFANELGIRYSEGLYKNPFIGRTFIMPNSNERKRSVRYKLTPQKIEIKDKNVLILDDSIVRGTTCREIIKMVREFGSKKIYFVSTCPPLKNPCYYGIDIPSRSELIAANNTIEKIQSYLGVDLLLYQEIDDLVEAVTRKGNHGITRPCMACLDGVYVAGQNQ